jgi:hypothetical protein
MTTIESELDVLRRENRKLRMMLFNHHGNAEHYLYGDDGERQCNTCWIDFNTDPVDVIQKKMDDYGMKMFIRAQSLCDHKYEQITLVNSVGDWERCRKCFSLREIQKTTTEKEKFCQYCNKEDHSDEECSCTRPVGWEKK